MENDRLLNVMRDTIKQYVEANKTKNKIIFLLIVLLFLQSFVSFGFFVIMKRIVNIILSKVLLTVKAKWKICKRMFICATHGGKMYGRRNIENQKKVKRHKFGRRI